MRRKWGEVLRTVTVTAVAVGLVSATGAVAAGELTGKDIENGSITSKDVKNLTLKDFKKKVRKKLNTGGPQGEQGPQGGQGPAGEDGEDGADGAPGTPGGVGNAVYINPQWGVITRNTIGSPVADLRGGPFGSFGVDQANPELAAPPYGDGSLGIAVADNSMADPPGSSTDPAEKVAFGNEVDFFGDAVGDLTEVGFHIFTTGENKNIAAANAPNIVFEIDPNLDPDSTSNYSSLVFVPEAAAMPHVGGGSWTPYIDATDGANGWWYLTGGAGTVTGCDQGADPCDFTELQAALDNGGDAATIYTAAVGKGRDDSFVGAVDGLRINDTIFDFEPFGVEEEPVPAP